MLLVQVLLGEVRAFNKNGLSVRAFMFCESRFISFLCSHSNEIVKPSSNVSQSEELFKRLSFQKFI